jgi:hypothetical protein
MSVNITFNYTVTNWLYFLSSPFKKWLPFEFYKWLFFSDYGFFANLVQEKMPSFYLYFIYDTSNHQIEPPTFSKLGRWSPHIIECNILRGIWTDIVRHNYLKGSMPPYSCFSWKKLKFYYLKVKYCKVNKECSALSIHIN